MRMRPASLTAAAPPSRFQVTHSVSPIEVSASTRKVIAGGVELRRERPAARQVGPSSPWPMKSRPGRYLTSSTGISASAHDALRDAAHERPADQAMTVGAHHDHVDLFLLRRAQDFLRWRPHDPGGAERDAVPLQEALDRLEHLLGFVAVVVVDDAGAEHGLDPGRHGRLHVQHHQLVVGAGQALVGGQEGQGFLGVLAAVGGQQHLH